MQHVLGSDGGGHYGRPDRCDRADLAGVAGYVRRMVSRETRSTGVKLIRPAGQRASARPAWFRVKREAPALN